MVRTLAKAAAVVAVALTAAPAYGGPPGGTSETENQVSCEPDGTPVTYTTGAITVHAGSDGVNVCSSTSRVYQGRVMVSSEGWVAVDGDADNSPDALDGYVRVDSTGVSTGSGDAGY